MGKNKGKQSGEGAGAQGSEEGGQKQAENWMDTSAGAAALGRRRLLRVVDAGDTQLLLYAGAKQLFVADCSAGVLIQCEQPHAERIGAVASHGGSVLVTGGDDKKLVIWDLPSMKVRSQTTTDKKIVAAVIDHAGTNVVFAEKAGEVFSKPIADPAAKSEHLLGHISSLTDMALSPSGQRLLTADRDEKIRISYYPHAFEIDAYCLGHTELVTCMCVFRARLRSKEKVGYEDGEEQILSAGADGTLRLWRVSDGELLDVFAISEAPSDKPQEPGGDGTDAGADDGKRKAWDHLAAGTAEGTAAVSGRMRGKCEATPLVALTQCVGTETATCGALVFAVAEEYSANVRLVQIVSGAIHSLGEVALQGPPVGLAALPLSATSAAVAGEGNGVAAGGHTAASGCLLLAATSSDQGAALEACAIAFPPTDCPPGAAPCTEMLDLVGSRSSSDGPQAEALRPLLSGTSGTSLVQAVKSLSEAIAASPLECADAEASRQGQDQYVQKRRRHMEPGWKHLHGKNK